MKKNKIKGFEKEIKYLERISIIFMILSFLLGFSIAMLVNIYLKDDGLNKITISKLPDYENCKSLNISETAYCLRDFVAGFYDYQLREDTIKTIEDIKRNGGDCYDYAHLYKTIAWEFGFNASTLITQKIEGVVPAHTWTIIWDDETYCEIDQLNVICREIKYEQYK